MPSASFWSQHVIGVQQVEHVDRAFERVAPRLNAFGEADVEELGHGLGAILAALRPRTVSLGCVAVRVGERQDCVRLSGSPARAVYLPETRSLTAAVAARQLNAHGRSMNTDPSSRFSR